MMTAWDFRGDEIFVATDEDGVDFHYFSCRFEIIEKIVDMVSGAEQIRVKISNGYSNPMVTLKREEPAESPTPPKKLVLGFVRVTAQDVHMVLNNPLSEKMNIGEDRIHPFPQLTHYVIIPPTPHLHQNKQIRTVSLRRNCSDLFFYIDSLYETLPPRVIKCLLSAVLFYDCFL